MTTDILRPYCEAMGIRNAESLPSGKAETPMDVQVHCDAMSLWGIKEALFPSRKKHYSVSDNSFTSRKPNLRLNPHTMNFQYTSDELNDFFAYDANRSIRLVAEDEGKVFTRILPKPAGYDEWLSRGGTISVSNWIAEKQSQKELDVNEIGRRMLKRSLFQTMGHGPGNSSSRARGGIRRSLAYKTGHSAGTQYPYPGTPHPRLGRKSMASSSRGTGQLYSGGRGLSPSQAPSEFPDSDSPAAALTDHGHLLTAENARLHRWLEELEARQRRGDETIESSFVF
ncbi:hypothetical protein M407DRAFT_33796 [Tulasnella calospora MUT 4182]|uniref:Uncharacterized protein n=1 Tax=Tulasnella calospora MUT 4182 TaxID=1051891 RepID=A0A0C3L4M1_9AGAM|nr:hypothetical protein M407DRAFT_33796 [Tulasnella calospora MUT 4182]